MDSNLIAVAEEGLKELRKASHADLLTCYFLNPHSGLLWLFFRDGDVNYDAQMHGPLTYPGQTERLIQVIKEHDVLKKGLFYFDPIPEILSLSQSISGVPPFIVREGIKRAVWVVIRRAEVPSPEGVDPWGDHKEIGVIVFLNYREGNGAPWNQTLENEIRIHVQLLTNTLQLLLDQPCMLGEEAWKLRNMSLRFFRELEGVLVVGDEQIVGDRLQGLCDSVVKYAFNLILPERAKNAKNVLCTLTMVDSHNQSKLLACYPKEKWQAVQSASSGIVDYVCRAGQICMVRDTEEYEKRWQKSGGNDVSLAQYVVCDGQTRCELACPLIVGERVLGVLNIEADKPNAYEKDHILMALQLASLAALVVRQRVIWESLSECIDMQPSLFHGGVSQDDGKILHQTMEVAGKLGYKADIWDCLTGVWKNDRNRDKPRENGYTTYVVKYRAPVAIADIRRSDSSFRLYKGQLNGATVLFEKWNLEPHPPYLISKALQKDAEGSTPVLTDLGFPIFEDIGPGHEGNNTAVRAVLWAKCHRRFMSLLHDESWALSFLCRNASIALGTRKRIRERFEARKTCVTFHFGDERGQVIDEQLRKNEALLDPKAASSIIVVNIDIRGSTHIGHKLLQRHQTKQYADFIKIYYEDVFRASHKYGGVVDKTMGDGVQLLFNVYRPDVVHLTPADTESKAMESAIMCVLEIFTSFSDFWKSRNYQEWHWRGGPFGLGAGMAMGDGFIGSFSGVRGSAMDYTVIGDVANNAGKLVNLARSKEIRKWVEQTHNTVNAPHVITSEGDWSVMKEMQITALLNKLGASGTGVSSLLIEPPPGGEISPDIRQKILARRGTSLCRVVNPDPESQINYLWVLFDPNT